MLYLLFSIPISIADLSQRKIPNIYLQIYAYYVGALLIVNGLPGALFMLAVIVTLGLFSIFGVGMGDCKLLALIVLMAEISNLHEFEYLLLAILLTSLIDILLRWGYSKVFPRTIAMAPAIFLGTSLYLATGGS